MDSREGGREGGREGERKREREREKERGESDRCVNRDLTFEVQRRWMQPRPGDERRGEAASAARRIECASSAEGGRRER